MSRNVHQLPCGTWEHKDFGCIDCCEYKTCMLWAVVRGEMRLPGEIERYEIHEGIIAIKVKKEK